MLTVIVFLFVIGTLLLAAEVILPGGVIGFVGGLLLFAGCVLCFTEYGATQGTVAVVTALAAVVAVFFVEFRILPKTALGRRAFLTREITAVSAPVAPEAKSLVGLPADALTVLAPSGYVLVEGRRYEAFCRTGHVPVGTALEVVGADNFRLIVKPTHYAIS